ncbi:MAG: FliH/SctL family protein [Thermodesulfobacteriota bacterium]
MEPFGHSSGSADKPEATFVSLQNNEKRRKGDFIPLARAGDGFEEQDKAAEIVRKAHEKAARIEQEAYEKGFNQGEKDGLELGEKKASKMTEHIEELLQGLIRLRGELVKHHEQDIIKLIFAIAKRIIKQTTKMNEDAVREVLFKAVNLATEKSEVTIRINPEDFDLVERLRPEFFAAFNDLKSVTVASDPSITQGGCLLETSSGEIDARIETQLERIYQSLEAAGDFET